jgi:hypothetical protein
LAAPVRWGGHFFATWVLFAVRKRTPEGGLHSLNACRQALNRSYSQFLPGEQALLLLAGFMKRALYLPQGFGQRPDIVFYCHDFSLPDVCRNHRIAKRRVRSHFGPLPQSAAPAHLMPVKVATTPESQNFQERDDQWCGSIANPPRAAVSPARDGIGSFGGRTCRPGGRRLSNTPV